MPPKKDKFGYYSIQKRDARSHWNRGKKRMKYGQTMKRISSSMKQDPTFTVNTKYAVWNKVLNGVKNSEYRLYRNRMKKIYDKYKPIIDKKPGSISVRIVPGYPRKDVRCSLQFKIVKMQLIDSINGIHDGILIKSSRPLIKITLGECEDLIIYKEKLKKIKDKYNDDPCDEFDFDKL